MVHRRPQSLADFTSPCRPSGTQLNYKLCPVCGHDEWKVYVNPETGWWFCHAGRHNAGGRIEIGLDPEHPGQDILDMLKPPPTVASDVEVELPEYEDLSDAALRYLKKRGIDWADASLMGMVEQADELRIIIPFFKEGRIVYWAARSYTMMQGGPKYKNADMPRQLYYLPAGHGKPVPLVVVEGVFDSIRLRQTGFASVAIGGTTVPEHLQKELLTLAAGYGTICVMLDSTALDKALKLHSFLRERLPQKIRVILYPPSDKPLDPSDLTVEQIQELLK